VTLEHLWSLLPCSVLFLTCFSPIMFKGSMNHDFMLRFITCNTAFDDRPRHHMYPNSLHLNFYKLKNFFIVSK